MALAGGALLGGPALGQDAPDRDTIARHVHALIAETFLGATQKLKIGPILVGEPSDGIHPVSVAGVSARLSDDPEDEGADRLVIDQFALIAEPLGQDRLRLTHVSMPDGPSILSADGRRVGSLGAASGRATGILALDLDCITLLDMAIDQPRLALDMRGEGGGLVLARAARLAADGADTLSTNGRWTSRGVATLTGLELRDETEARYDLASLSVEGTIDGVPDAAMKMLAELDATSGIDAVSADILRAGLLDDMALSIAIGGLAVTGAPDWPEVGLERVNAGIDLSGLLGDTARVGLTIGMAGLTTNLSGPNGEPWGVGIPDRLDMDLAVEGVPAALIWQAAARDLEGSDDLDDAAMAILAAAPLVLSLDRLALAMDGAEVEATGTLRADPGAAFGAVGQLNLMVEDMLTLKTLVETLAPPDARREAVDLFDYIHGNAEPARDGTGRAMWRFELLASGEILMNGAPFQPPQPRPRP